MSVRVAVIPGEPNALRLLLAPGITVTCGVDERGNPVCPCCWEPMFEIEPGQWTCREQQSLGALIGEFYAARAAELTLERPEPFRFMPDGLAAAAVRAAGAIPAAMENP